MPRIENVRVWGENAPRTVTLGSDGPSVAVDGTGMVLAPSLVDVGCDPGFPGFPVRETPESLGNAALAGGFGDLVTRPCVDPVPDQPEHLADQRRTLPGTIITSSWTWPM